MDSFMDSALLVTTLGGGFGAALMLQKVALRLMLRAMDRRRT